MPLIAITPPSPSAPQALEQIADATAQASKRADAAVARALEAAADSRRALLDALQSAMDPPALLSQAAALAASPREEVARRAVTLLTRRVVSLASEPPSARELVMTRAEKAEREALVSEAALSALAPLQETVRKGRTPGTVQGALQAVDALAKAFGGQSGERFVPAAAAVAAALGNATSAAVRGSALVTLAAVTTTVGARALPQLPVMMGAVLAAAEAAAAWMSEHRSSGEDDEEEDEAKKGREEGLLVAASSIAALLAAAEALPQFLSPYLGRILHIAVHPGFSKDPR